MLIWEDFQDVLNGNVMPSLSLVEGKVSGKMFLSVWLPRTVQGFLEGRQEQPRPLGRGGLSHPCQLPTSCWYLGGRMEDKGISNRPLPEPEPSDPKMKVGDPLLSWPAFWEQKWRNSTIYIKLKQGPVQQGGWRKFQVPFLKHLQVKTNPMVSAPAWAAWNIYSGPLGIWVWGPTPVSRGSRLAWPW